MNVMHRFGLVGALLMGQKGSMQYGEPKAAPVVIPEGYRRMRQSEVTPELTAEAIRIRREYIALERAPYGTLIPFELETGSYAAIIEQHYHPPGGPIKPWGYHPGVTLLVAI